MVPRKTSLLKGVLFWLTNHLLIRYWSSHVWLYKYVLFLSFTGPVWLHWWPPHGNGSSSELSGQCIRVHEQPRGSEQPSSVTFLPTRIPAPLQHPWGTITFSCRLSCRKQPVTIWPNFSCKYSRYSLSYSLQFYSVVKTDPVYLSSNIRSITFFCYLKI